MNATEVAEKRVLKKIQKRLQKVIRTYEKLITKMESQLEKVNRLDEEEVVATVRLTIGTGIDQARKFLIKAQLDYHKVVAKQSSFVRSNNKS